MSRFYASWKEARAVLALAETKSQAEYQHLRKTDHRLPSCPYEVYRDVWEKNGGWVGFLGNQPRNYYASWQEANAASIRLKIKTSPEYRKRFREDPRLSPTPEALYHSVWSKNGGWYGFLGNKQPDLYPTWEAAMAAAIQLKIKTSTEYAQNYKQDPRLPSCPNAKYADVWERKGRWSGFLNKPNITIKGKLETIGE